MSNQVLFYIMGGSVAVLVVIILVYYILSKKMQKSEYRQIKKLQQGTKEKTFSTEILFQQLYIRYIRIPFLKRYILKLRRRLEIINIDDEYNTRKDAAKILTKALAIVIPVAILTIIITHSSYLIMFTLLIFELFMIDTLIDGSIDKKDTNLLKEQLDFFSEIRHAYHEFNMVEEAIYQVSQDDERDISRQGDRIYETLIADDPEMELEKYYDIAPNVFLKEFAGISYLTKEFGDRKVNGASLYLRNINNITKEMQLEILKRDKLNYVFQSLSLISIAPVLLLELLKSWAIGNFAFTQSWYNGKPGMIVQILILILTIVCYILVRRLKDNGSTAMNTKNTENPWQAKLYKNRVIKKIVDLFIPKEGTKEYRKNTQLLKDAASHLRMEWLYINRITLAIVTCIVSLVVFVYLHKLSIDYIYTQPTTEYDILGEMTETQTEDAMELTRQDNAIIDQFKGNIDATVEQVRIVVARTDYFEEGTDSEITADAERIFDKIQIVNSEYLKWFEVLLSFVFAIIGYMAPIALLMFQVKMRQIEMEDEVMQFQTIILMLMRIERVNVEMILEWLERYANIFKEPIGKCLNNYEAGAWEALEEMKEEISYMPLVRIVESMQAAVEKIPIKDAFDELESERDYYQEKRKESNDRLIKRKGMIGKAIGFAPMICMFVGYLIIPLVFIGLTSMSSTMTNISSQQGL